jgi:hypothetical protein
LDVEFPTQKGKELLNSDNPLKMIAELEPDALEDNAEGLDVDAPQPA